MADDRDDFQRGRSQPARQRGNGAATQGQQRRAERQPRNDTHEAVKNSRGRHLGLGTSGCRIDVVSDEPGGHRRLRLGGGLPGLPGGARVVGGCGPFGRRHRRQGRKAG